MPSLSLAPYRALLRRPGTVRLVATSVVARMPTGRAYPRKETKKDRTGKPLRFLLIYSDPDPNAPLTNAAREVQQIKEELSKQVEAILLSGVDIGVEVELMLLDVDGVEKWLEPELERNSTAFRSACLFAIHLRRPDVVKLLDKTFGKGKWQSPVPRTADDASGASLSFSARAFSRRYWPA